MKENNDTTADQKVGLVNPTSIIASRMNALSHDMIDLKQQFKVISDETLDKNEDLKVWVIKQIKLFRREQEDFFTNP